jgi:hypothetical protein
MFVLFVQPLFWTGWPCAVYEYKWWISGIINRMFELLASDVLPENRTIIDVFLGHKNFTRLELMLRNVSGYYWNLDGAKVDEKLKAYTDDEYARLEKNLEGVKYDIDDMNTLKLITGKRCVSTSLFPILLQHHQDQGELNE